MKIASRRLGEFTHISPSSSAFAIIVKYNNILFKYLVVVPQYFRLHIFRLLLRAPCKLHETIILTRRVCAGNASVGASGGAASYMRAAI